MKTRFGLLFLAILLGGCQAHMVETQGGSPTLVSVIKPQAQQKSGVIRYLNTGLSSWRKARRADAETQMSAFCGGAYTIIAEGSRSKFGADMPIGKSVSFEMDEYWYIRFECPPPAK